MAQITNDSTVVASGQRGALGLVHLPVALIAALLFLALSFRSVGGADLWSDIAYGGVILDQRSLPAEDPIATLARGFDYVDLTWLSRALLAAVNSWGGGEALSALSALCGVAIFLVLVRLLFLRSGRILVALAGALIALVLAFPEETIGPRSFALLVFSLLLWLLVGAGAESQADRPGARLWIGVPLLSALWANLHHSFPVAALLIGCFWIGRLIERRRGGAGWRELLDDRWLKRWFLLGELSVVGTLLNPYGLDLWMHTLGLTDNSLLMGRAEWRPLVLADVPGGLFALAVVGLALVSRKSPRETPASHVVLVALFGAAAALRIGALTWFAPVYALALVPHLAALAPRPEIGAHGESGGRWARLTGYRSRSFTLLAAMISLAALALSPAASALAPERARNPLLLYGPGTPYLVSGHLNANPPRGLTLAPDWWSGWLTLDGPPQMELMVSRDVIGMPRRVWADYRDVSTAHAAWSRLLTRYAVDTVIVDAARQRDLGMLLRQSDEWGLSYEDAQALVFRRFAPEDEPPAPEGAS